MICEIIGKRHAAAAKLLSGTLHIIGGFPKFPSGPIKSQQAPLAAVGRPTLPGSPLGTCLFLTEPAPAKHGVQQSDIQHHNDEQNEVHVAEHRGNT